MLARPLLMLAIVLLPLAALAEEPAAEAADRITFTVTGLKSDKGTLRCGLFPEDSWMENSVGSADAKVENARAVCEFEDLPAGTYGINAYHDKNDNGRLDVGFMRIPKEDYAASNNARSSFGPPKIEDARFVYEGGLLELSAKIR